VQARLELASLLALALLLETMVQLPGLELPIPRVSEAVQVLFLVSHHLRLEMSERGSLLEQELQLEMTGPVRQILWGRSLLAAQVVLHLVARSSELILQLLTSRVTVLQPYQHLGKCQPHLLGQAMSAQEPLWALALRLEMMGLLWHSQLADLCLVGQVAGMAEVIWLVVEKQPPVPLAIGACVRLAATHLQHETSMQVLEFHLARPPWEMTVLVKLVLECHHLLDTLELEMWVQEAPWVRGLLLEMME